MIYLYAILLPRFLMRSGSIVTAKVLGGLGYTAMHMLVRGPYTTASAIAR
jgi:hypothetical protein